MSSVPLFLPGWAIPPSWYRPCLSALCPEMEIIDPGFYGNGIEAFSPAAYLRRLEATNCSGRILLAHSLGTMFALRAAARCDQVRALILFNPFARFSEAPGYPGRPTRDIRAMQLQLRRDPQTLLDNFIKTVYRPDCPPSENPEGGQATSLAAGLQCLLEEDFREDLPSVRCPTLLLCGGADAISGQGQAAFLAAALPDAELCTFEHGGHALPLTAESVCIDGIRNFMLRRKMEWL